MDGIFFFELFLHLILLMKLIFLAIHFDAPKLFCSDLYDQLPTEEQAIATTLKLLFASQPNDVNIALSSIGLIWNLIGQIHLRITECLFSKIYSQLYLISGPKYQLVQLILSFE
jgi:hypothetical protein